MTNNNNNINIVLTCIQNFQEYILINIEQLIKLGHKNIYILTNSHLIQKFDQYKTKVNLIIIDNYIFPNEIYNKHYSHRSDNNFRNGFWTFTSLRFFYVYEFMKNENIENVIHLENDVLIYYNCDDTLKNCLDNNFVYIPFDTFERNIASIIYIPNYLIFEKILDKYDYYKNDMYNFSLIQKNTNLIQNLPIFINDNNNNNAEFQFVTNNFNKFNYIFDAAAIGQYLGGVDPLNISGNTIGFINETCIIKYNNYIFEWIIVDEMKKPFIIINGLKYKIFNLHIHSKRLNEFIYTI
jgi:hypothetical protein